MLKPKSFLFVLRQREVLLPGIVVGLVGIRSQIALGIDKEFVDVNAPRAIQGTNVTIVTGFVTFSRKQQAAVSGLAFIGVGEGGAFGQRGVAVAAHELVEERAGFGGCHGEIDLMIRVADGAGWDGIWPVDTTLVFFASVLTGSMEAMNGASNPKSPNKSTLIIIN
mmetsp:Transcript_27481/g.42280  ORF Transcript_27481/g.42280 Transcript_27481/m.42280 type:complete len:166 (-) Transcript_27481:9-506(-)